MKKLSIFLLSLLTVFGLVACGGKKDPTKEPTDEKTEVVDPTQEQTKEPTQEQTKEPTQESHPDPVTTDHTVLLGQFDGWGGSDDYEMIEITMDDYAKIDAEEAKRITDARVEVESVYFFPNHKVTSDAEWTFKANGVEYNGGHALKAGFAQKTVKWDDMEEAMVTTWAVTQWIPNPHDAHVESLTPETYFVPNWAEEYLPGQEDLGKWDENPAVTAPDGEYHIVLIKYAQVSDEEHVGYGIGVYAPETKSVRVTGDAYGWGDSNAIMTQISVEELQKINADMAAKVEGNEKAEIYKLENHVLKQNPEPSWWAEAWNGKEVVKVNPGYTIKAIDVTEKIFYDEFEESIMASKSTDAWMPDPHKFHMENLTPETLFIPAWVETAPEGQEGLGTWDKNPVCVAGSGEYTVILIKYGQASSSEVCSAGLGLIQTKKIEEEEIKPELKPAEKALAEAVALGDKKDSQGHPVKGETEYTLEGVIKAFSETKNNEKGSYNTNMIVEVDGIKFSIINAQVNGAYPVEPTGLKVGDKITFVGHVENSQKTIEEVVGQANFYKAAVSWVTEHTYGIVGTINDWGKTPDIELVKGEDGIYRAEVELTEGAEIKVRMDSAWDKDWSDAGYKGANFKCAQAGTYVVTLDLSQGDGVCTITLKA